MPQQLEIFQEVETLGGYTDFREFEEEYEDSIFYADGKLSYVLDAMEEELNNVKYVVFFDGWYVALNEYL